MQHTAPVRFPYLEGGPFIHLSFLGFLLYTCLFPCT